MVGQESRLLTVTEALEQCPGLSRTTLHRRATAWENGDRSPYAIKTGRTSQGGRRRIDSRDLDRVRRQLAGELPLSVTAEEWAQRSED